MASLIGNDRADVLRWRGGRWERDALRFDTPAVAEAVRQETRARLRYSTSLGEIRSNTLRRSFCMSTSSRGR